MMSVSGSGSRKCLLGLTRRRPGPSSSPRSRWWCCRGLECDRLRCLAGRPTPPTKADLFRQTGPPLRIAGRGQGMFTRQIPVHAILLHGQSMSGRDMASEHLAAPPTFEADHEIPVNGSPDQHRGCALAADFCYGFPETCERLMDGRDQGRELIGPDLVATHVSGDNRRSEFSIK